MGGAGNGEVAPSVPNNDKQKLANLLNASVGWTSPDQTLASQCTGQESHRRAVLVFCGRNLVPNEFTAAAPRTLWVTVRGTGSTRSGATSLGLLCQGTHYSC
jgi:hypothetical protein